MRYKKFEDPKEWFYKNCLIFSNEYLDDLVIKVSKWKDKETGWQAISIHVNYDVACWYGTFEKFKQELTEDMADSGVHICHIYPKYSERPKTPYQEYLNSEQWKQRSERLKMLDGQCLLCLSMDNLETHHRTYKRKGNEFDSDLVTLCHDCHESYELGKKMRKNQPTPDSDDFLDFTK